MSTPDVAESRLAGVPVHMLRERLELARTSLQLAQTMFTRRNAIAEIEMCAGELKRRGYQVTA